jgi:menaquinol-cytochrome c reductase iron-sulfur subunit
MNNTSDAPPPSDSLPERRTFFRWLTYGLGAIAAAAASIPFIGYLFGARKAPVLWVPLGPVENFPENETQMVTFDNPIRQPWSGMVAHTGVYVRYLGRDDKKETDATKGYRFLVLGVNCAHLGCPVEWFAESGLFMCPCHGGVYYANGEHASGPPPRGLFACNYQVTQKNGLNVLEIQAPHFPTLHDTLRHPV